MSHQLRRVRRRLAVIASLSTFALLPASAAEAAVTVDFACQASAAGQTAQSTLKQGVAASAPARVGAGKTVSVVLDPAPNRVPASVAGRTVKNVNTLALAMPLPPASRFTGAKLTGGSGLGTRPSIVRSGGSLVLKVPGPIAGGARFELPTITLTLVAAKTGTIITKLGGTSYAVPGLTFTAAVKGPFGSTINAAGKCFPKPSPILTRTVIG